MMSLLGHSDPTLRHIQSFFLSAMEAEGTGLLKPRFYVAEIRQAAKTMFMKVNDRLCPKFTGRTFQEDRRRFRRLPIITAAQKNI